MRIAAAHVRNVYATAFADCRASNRVSKPSFIFTHVFALYCRAYVMPYEKNKQTNKKKEQSPNVHPVLIERSNEYFSLFFFSNNALLSRLFWTRHLCEIFLGNRVRASYLWKMSGAMCDNKHPTRASILQFRQQQNRFSFSFLTSPKSARKKNKQMGSATK